MRIAHVEFLQKFVAELAGQPEHGEVATAVVT